MGKLANQQVTTGTSTTTYPDWYTNASKGALNAVQQFFAQPTASYTQPRVAALPGMSQDAISQMGSLTPPGATTERIVDETGRLGAVDDYMNPYARAALDPALREMAIAHDQERNRISGQRQGMGGYGDARHGVLEGTAGQRYQTAVGDVTGRTMGAAYDSAMGLRSADLSRFNQQDQQAFQNTIAAIQAKLQAGQLTQQQAQNELDAQYAEFMRLEQDKYDKIATYVGGVGGLNPGSTTTETGRRGLPVLSAIGQIGGSLLGGWLGGG